MSSAILVLNAGSSSVKFSVFLEQDESLALLLGGQLEGLSTAPHFVAKDASGIVLSERQWAQGATLGHDFTCAFLATPYARRLTGSTVYVDGGVHIMC